MLVFHLPYSLGQFPPQYLCLSNSPFALRRAASWRIETVIKQVLTLKLILFQIINYWSEKTIILKLTVKKSTDSSKKPLFDKSSKWNQIIGIEGGGKLSFLGLLPSKVTGGGEEKRGACPPSPHFLLPPRILIRFSLRSHVVCSTRRLLRGLRRKLMLLWVVKGSCLQTRAQSASLYRLSASCKLSPS